MKYALSAPEKIDLISGNIERRLGEGAAKRFRGAVVLYAARGDEPFESESFYEDYWANTKVIVDKAKRRRFGESGPNPFLLFIRNLEKLEYEIQERKAKKMSDEGNIGFSEALALLEEYGDTFSVEGYQAGLIEGGRWESYEEFVECALLVLDCDRCDYPEWNPVYRLWSCSNSAKRAAERHGNIFTYEEMLDTWVMLKMAQEEKNWELWSNILHFMYDEHSDNEAEND